MVCVFSIINTAFAKIDVPNKDLASLMIMHEGRVKPIETIALNYYRWFQGEGRVSHDEAMLWFQQTIFDPETAASKPLFYIQDSWLREQLRQKKAPEKDTFSLLEIDDHFSKIQNSLTALLDTPESERSKQQQALIELFEKKNAYSELLQSLSLFISVPMVAQAEDISFFDLYDQKERYAKSLQEIIKEKGSNIANYSEEEANIALTSYQMDMLTMGGRKHKIFRVLPIAKGVWLSPWELLLQEQDKTMLRNWQSAVHAYKNDNGVMFDDVLSDIRAQQVEKDFVEVYETQIWAEQRYNAIDPFYVAFWCYFLVLLVFAVSHFKQHKYEAYLTYGFLAVGSILHALGLGLRMLILERPPVSTLYESVIFVSFISICCSVFFMFKFKNVFYFYATLFVAFVLLMISDFFLSGQDSLQVLVAVLNTNFWLATHVVMITIGYGLCLVCACMAHGWLFLPLITKQGLKQKRQKLFKHTYFVGLLALVFTLIGTILGGVWADQSWGRFWGWDPKENGALLIVLWLIWVFHGHVSSLFNRYWVMVALAALTIIVTLSWFGVNLLSIGLHSYGFISGLAIGVSAFCAVQLLILACSWMFKGVEEIK